MRWAAEELLQDEAGFISVNSTSENTALPDYSVDFITAAQAFHWFNIEEYKKNSGASANRKVDCNHPE